METIAVISLFMIIIYIIYKYIQVSNIDKESILISKSEGVILDIRSNKAYKNKHIDGAINITMNDIFKGAYKNLDKKQTYYVYCYLGLRSIRVSTFLKEKGFENIINCGSMNEINKYILK